MRMRGQWRGSIKEPAHAVSGFARVAAASRPQMEEQARAAPRIHSRSQPARQTNCASPGPGRRPHPSSRVITSRLPLCTGPGADQASTGRSEQASGDAPCPATARARRKAPPSPTLSTRRRTRPLPPALRLSSAQTPCWARWPPGRWPSSSWAMPSPTSLWPGSTKPRTSKRRMPPSGRSSRAPAAVRGLCAGLGMHRSCHAGAAGWWGAAAAPDLCTAAHHPTPRPPTPLCAPAVAGIGKSIARKLAGQGLNVVLVALGDDVLDATHKELAEQYPRVIFRKARAGFRGAPRRMNW